MSIKSVVLAMIALFGLFLVADVPQAEARFGSRYASRSGWRPGKVLLKIRHANADRRASRRAEGRGLFPGYVARQRGYGSCVSSAPASCPSCPSSKTTTTTVVEDVVTKDCPECPNGVCPKK